MSMNRREFLRSKTLAAVGAAAALAGVAAAGKDKHTSSPSGRKTPLSLPVLNTARSGEQEDVLIRMQRELVRAMAKPAEKRRWGMVIDTRRCVACMACTVGCVVENKLPPGVVYRPVLDMEVGKYPDVRRRFLPRPCMQCENPPCVPVCPVGATWKRSDGIIEIDYNACIGCRYCITACPYQARTFDFGENWTNNAAHGPNGALALQSGRVYDKEPSFEYGREWHRKDGLVPESPVGNTRKCMFCIARLEKGMLPMCVTTCIARATRFGDLNDPDSLVSEMSVQNNAVRLKEELGTNPKVYYVV